MLKKWSVPALLACLSVHSLTARNLFVTSADLASSAVSAFSVEPLSFAGTFTGPVGASQVLAGPGGKYYIISRQASEGIAVAQGTFPSLQITKRIPTPGNAVAAALSPDGRRLVVVGGGVTIVDTATDNPIQSAVNVANPTAVAVSTDSRRAFVLSSASQKLYIITVENGASAGEVAVPGTSTAVSVGPNTLVYVSAQNAIYEVDPQSLQQNNTFPLNGLPGPIAFSPDGRTGIATNAASLAPITQRAAFILDLPTRAVTNVAYAGVVFNKIIVASNTTAYGLSSGGQVYTMSLGNTAPPALLNVGGTSLNNIRDIVLSNEVPAARKLFVLTNTSLYAIDLIPNNLTGPLGVTTPGNLSFAGPAATGAINALLQINGTQNVVPGGPALPLIVQATDANGVPVSGVTIQFTTASGIGIQSASAVTDLLGYAQTYVTVPSTQGLGLATVTAAGGGQQVTFNFNVSTTGGGGNNGGGVPTGGLEIVKGQGQITSVGFPLPEFMTVRVKDTAGRPLAGAPVVWKLVQGDGSLLSTTGTVDANGITTLTDDKGQAGVSFSNPLVGLGVPFTQSVISASNGTETVNFTVTTVANLPNGSRGDAIISLRKPTDLILTARAGDTTPGVVEAVVASLFGPPIPNVGLRIATPDGAPSASCRGGIALSDATGLITCDLTGGPLVGETTAQIIIGEKTAYPVVLRVEAGAPSVVRITGGNNQTGNAGTLLPAALAIEVTDAGGNLLPNVDVAFEVVTPGTATLSQTSSRTDFAGRASTRVTLGQTPGLVQIRARAGTGTATFSLTANPNATSMQKGAGSDNQTAAMGEVFATPLTVTVLNAQSQPVVAATIGFQVTSGSATLSAPSALTNASGVASVNVTAGQTPGPVVITASIGGITQTFNLTVRTPGPSFTAQSFVNAAGFQPGISPGGLTYITAAGIAPGVRGSVTPQQIVGPLPTSLAGVEVLFNNIAAPLFAVSNINNVETVVAQVPFELTPGAVSVTIRTATGGSTTVNGVQILPVKPGIFTFQDTNSRTYAVALRPDGSYVSLANPARRGEIIRVFADGLGQTTPVAVTNRLGVRDQNVVGTVISGINDAGVRTVSAKLSESQVGVYIVEMEIPETTTPGDNRPLAVGVVGSDGQPVYGGSAIPIQ